MTLVSDWMIELMGKPISLGWAGPLLSIVLVGKVSPLYAFLISWMLGVRFFS